MAREGEIQHYAGVRASQGTDGKARLLAAVFAQKERLFLFSPVLLGVGISLYFSLRTEPPSWLCLSAPLLLAALLFGLWPRRLQNGVFYMLALMAISGFLLSAGVAVAKARTMLVSAPILEKPMGPVDVVGRIAALETLEAGEGVRLLLRDLAVEDIAPADTPHTIRIKVRRMPLEGLRPGDRISVLAELNPPSAPVAPGAYDFQRMAYFRQMGAFGFSYREPVVIGRAAAGASLWLESLRQHIIGRIARVIPLREAGIANALMTGERTAIAAADMDDMRNSGLVHIISISGLHISMIAGVIFFTLRLAMACFPTFAVYHPIKKYAAIGALLFTVLYTGLVGATVPTVRSVIMTGLVLLAVMLDRIPVSLRVVAIAALIILATVPEAVVGPSFQMSFAAVMGLVAFYEATRDQWVAVYRRCGWFRRGLIYLAGICVTTVIASIATAPFSIYHFQQFANYGLLANLLAVPLTSFVIMPAMLLGYLLMPLGWEAPALWAMGQGISGMIGISHFVANLPHAVSMPYAWPLSALLCFSAGWIFLCLLQGWGRLLSVVPVIAGIITVLIASPPDLLISASGKLMAVKDPEGKVYMSTVKAEKFVAESWMRVLGRGGEIPEILLSHPAAACDEWACRLTLKDKKISFAFHSAAHGEECRWADIVLADDPVRVRPCMAKTTIDRFDVWKNGVHAIWLNEETIQSVGERRGHRPWTISNSR
ncbi:MAG: ComEC/Rec2 family competence protein [Micavibrio aeruginosavorus]|uniref:ComEC/Rec2 family competence protein n=1 Tax=Micavibrio aeruginosavorus TaxID=349221 RepID=A0A7T5R0S8_9BACT|nr:MAG: ComEC/Rec2 family competence protein [Micavibrio aeruginosavorus]